MSPEQAGLTSMSALISSVRTSHEMIAAIAPLGNNESPMSSHRLDDGAGAFVVATNQLDV
jgi:hypothetical protein